MTEKDSGINWIASARGGNSGGRGADYAFYLSNHAAGRVKGKAAVVQGSIRVSAEAMKRLRWIAGDRVMIGRDETHVYLRRVPVGGYALSPTGGGKKSGTVVACNIKTSRICFPTQTYCNEGEYAVLDDGTVMVEAKSEVPK